MLELFIALIALGGFVVVLFLIGSIYIVRQAETIIIERLGQFNRILGPGFHIVIPFFESTRRVVWSFVVAEGPKKQYYRFTKVLNRIDLREAVYDFPKQNVITKDNVTMEINALLYYHIVDPKAAVYEVNNLPEAIEKLTQTTLRNVIGSMDLDESLVSRDQINERLRIILDEATDKWGVKVNRVELQEVNPPHDIRQAMEKQMRAERDRRAIILESEGKKRSAILEAEGKQESSILRAKGAAEAQIIEAQGEANARMQIAQAEAKAMAMIREVLPQEGDAVSYLIALQYFKMLPELARGKDDKLILVPYEAASLMGSISSVKALFEKFAEPRN